MNILVTGSQGYIGKSLTEKLSNYYNLIKLSNSAKYNCTNNDFALDLLNKKHVGDFLNEDLEIDIIIHVASKMASSENMNDMKIFHDNIKMYENLVLIISHYKPLKVINFSSIAIYPNIEGNYNEESAVRPSMNNDALYGLSKFCGENILDYFLKKSRINVTHLRVSQVYSDDMREDRLYQVMKKELKEKNQITVYGNGERLSNFIDKSRLIEYVLFFIKNDKFGIYNIGDLNITYNDFAYSVIKKFGNSFSIVVKIENGSKNKVYIDTNKFEGVRTECFNR